MTMMMPGITRSFQEVDRIADLWQRGRYIEIPSNAGWTETNVAGGDTLFASERMRLDTSGTGSSSTLVSAQSFGLAAGNGNRWFVDWSKKLRIQLLIASGLATANTTFHFALKEVDTIGGLAEKGLGLKLVNLALTGESYNSALGSNAIATLTTVYDYLVEIRHYPSVPKVEFWLDGVLSATETTSTKVPQALGSSIASWTASIGNAATTDRGLIDVGQIRAWQER